MITVVNVKTAIEYQYVGRSRSFGASVLGNPFIIGRDGDRYAVINKYRHWLWAIIQNKNSSAYNELLRLAQLAATSDLVLGCHCAPEACHGDVIKRAIKWINS